MLLKQLMLRLWFDYIWIFAFYLQRFIQKINYHFQVSIKSMKFVKGMWVNGLLNQFYQDICKDMAHPKSTTAWTETLKPLTVGGICPFVKVNLSMKIV